MDESLSQLLQRRLNEPTEVRSVLVPGVFNALSAVLAQRAGFECLYLSGSATAAANYGLPDIGLIGRSEMATNCTQVASAVRVPVIVDADTGYGGPNDVRQTVTSLLRAGASAITIEDQVLEKRCGYSEGVRVEPPAVQARRIRAAALAKKGSDLLIVGRTDALSSNGLEDALNRCRIMADAGADVVWIVGLQKYSAEELRQIRANLLAPALIDYTELEASRNHDFHELALAGYELVLVALTGILASIHAMAQVYSALASGGDWMPYRESLTPFDEYNNLVGMDRAAEFEAKVDGAESEAGQ